MAANFAFEAGSAIAGHQAQSKASKANKANAMAAEAETFRAIGTRQLQQQQATGQSIMQIDRQARASKALAAVSAGEAGVAGASVDALLSDIDVERLDAETTMQKNLAMQEEQLQSEKRGAIVQTQNRINSVPPPSATQTALQIAGAGLQFGTDYIRRKGSVNKG